MRRIIEVLVVLIVFTTFLGSIAPAKAGLGSPHLSIGASLSPCTVEWGQSATLTVTVSETGGEDWAKDVVVTPEVGEGSNIIFSPSESSPVNIKRNGSAEFSFKVFVPEYEKPGQKKIVLYVEYGDTGWLDIGETRKHITKEIYLNVKKPPATLVIKTAPTGSSVYINGVYKGTTPLSLKLESGSYDLVVKKEGYTTFQEMITLHPGKTVTVYSELTPLPTPAPTQVYSTPTYVPPTTSELQHSQFSWVFFLFPIIVLSLIVLLYLVRDNIPLTVVRDNIPLVVFGLTSRSRGLVKHIERLISGQGQVEEKKVDETEKYELSTFPQQLLSKYEPLEFLGEGGFARVFKVKRSDGKIIALKISNLDEKARKFFMKEIKAWKFLDHPNIVKLYDAFEEPIPHLEIEYVDGIELNGKNIRDLGNYPKPIDEKTALRLIKGIAEGLKHAHSKNVFHRDLKPQNILLESNLTPKITDWGLAKVGAISTTATTTKGLTLLYAAPEQIDEESYGCTDQRTDIYQLGLIFYELRTGKLLYEGGSPAVVMAKIVNPDTKPKLPSQINENLAKYDPIFEKLIAKRKEDRFQNINELLEAIESLEAIEKEKEALTSAVTETKTTMLTIVDTGELRKLKKQVVELSSRLALLNAKLNDKAELLKNLEDLKEHTRKHKEELENAISQFELMLREGITIGKESIDSLKVLLHELEREVEE